MRNQKEKEKFIERIEFTDPEYAQEIYNKEHSRFKFKLICAGIALLTSIIWFFVEAVEDLPIISDILGVIGLAGYVAAIISCPTVIIKTIFKVARFMYWLVPIIILDLLAAVFGFVYALMAFLYAPVAYCAIGIYQSYVTLKEAKTFLAYYETPETVEDVEG